MSDKTEIILPPLTVSSVKNGPVSNAKIGYRLDGDTVSVILDKEWLKSQPSQSFPLVIDPTYVYYTQYHTGIPGGDLGHFMAYKSDGYVCNSTNCDLYVGGLNDNGLKKWRSTMHLPFTDVYGKNVAGASIYTERIDRPYAWSGFEGNKQYWATWANCFGYNCISGAPQATGIIDWGGYLDATALMQWVSQNNVGDGWLTMWGNESSTQSFKAFSGAKTFLDVTYYNSTTNRKSDIPTLVKPLADAKVIVNRPTLKMNSVTDPDGDTVKYSFHLLDSMQNVVAYAGELDVPEWTVPGNVLVDGEKYSWKGWVMERNSSNPAIIESGWRPTNETRSFTYDTLMGKDKTQTYDEVGPASVSLNTGDVSFGAASHTIGALGGNVGISLDYNNENPIRPGLEGRYYNSTTITGLPALFVQDPNIDFDWGTGSPYPGVIQADNFTVRWSGYFIPPQDGVYRFGGTRDDTMSIVFNEQQYLSLSSCCGTTWGTQDKTLEKGKPYSIQVTVTDTGGGAQAKLLVRTPDGVEQTVPSEWLMGSIPPDQVGAGLKARFYKNDDPTNNPNYLINEDTPLVLSTTVPSINSNWSSGSLVPTDPGGQYSDNMIINYRGYVTIPTTGNYKFGGSSDDGLRIRLGGQQVYSHSTGSGLSSPMSFQAGERVPIQVDYWDVTGNANVTLNWDGPAGSGVIPGQYFTVEPNVVPKGWTLSIDPDGNIPYESLQVRNNGSVELIDSTGFVHLYSWNSLSNTYKPPVNEDGYLVKNDDNSYTLTDSDGRVYKYSAEGVILSITSPDDDLNPGGLRYEYSNTVSSTYSAHSRLHKVIDGVDPSRYGQLYYWGTDAASGVCTQPAQTLNPPAGFLCAFKTFPDGRITKMQYTGSPAQLNRIEKPGGALISVTQLYNSNTGYKINHISDIGAQDAKAAGVVGTSAGTTSFTYDSLGRAKTVTETYPYGTNTYTPPFPAFPYQVPRNVPNNTARVHQYDYSYQSTKYRNPALPEPNGYQQYVEYDNLFRTTKTCDAAALCATTQWHPEKDLVLSATDATGLKTTTIYDKDDRAIEKYGAAPASWFGTDNKPTATYVGQVPKVSTGYDESISGPAVAWYGARGQSLFGSPKLHTTGVDTADPNNLSRDFQLSSSPPVSVDLTTPGYGFSATGQISFPESGMYTFKINHDDGARMYVNDNLIIDNWTTRTAGASQNSLEGTFNAEANKSYRIRLDYIHFDDGVGAGKIETWLRGPGITDVSGTGLGTNSIGSLIKPAYGLITSMTAHDSQLGDTTTKTNYSDPAYGLISSTVIDPNGLNYINEATYEAPGTGYLRQLTMKNQGGNNTSYEYYGATQQVDNPCTVTVDLASQAGQMKTKTAPDPDGSGSQVGLSTETIYDSSGRQVATRANQDDWTCIQYDARGRILSVVVPAKMDGSTVIRAGKSITNNYAYGGNPLVATTQDESGVFTLEERDLNGNIVRTVDSSGQTTSFVFDAANRLSTKTSVVGTEKVLYDSVGRATKYLLDNVELAIVNYDQMSRIDSIQYPQSKDIAGNTLKLEQVSRDTLGRENGGTFRFSDNSTFVEAVTRSISGVVTSSTNNMNGLVAGSTYTYDKAGRLTTALVDNMKYSYDYSAPNSSTCGQASANLNAHKNTNRTSYEVENLTNNTVLSNSNYCYDKADRLISSSDVQVGTPVYDDHGNTTSISGNGASITFAYNNLDQNTSITQGTNKVEYTRSVDDSILRKKEYSNGNLVKSYRYSAGGRTLEVCSLTNDSQCTIADKYVTLPGGVTLTLSPTNPNSAKQVVYSIKNFHGDTTLTVGQNGLPTSAVYLYEPFGLASQSDTFGTNSSPQNSSNEGMGWAASPIRKQESLFSIPIIQMGARTYLPTLGRFMQVDPIEGGTPNAYVYPGDPINGNDYSGKLFWFAAIAVARIMIYVAPIMVAATKAVPAVVRVVASVANAVGSAVASAARAVAPSVGRATSASKVVRAGNTGSKATSAAGRVHEGYKGPMHTAPNSPGVYQFVDSSNRTYTGMTTRSIATRLQEHVASGKLAAGSQVRAESMQGASRLQLRVKEQTWLNQSGGVGNANVGNKINSVGSKRWDELGIPSM